MRLNKASTWSSTARECSTAASPRIRGCTLMQPQPACPKSRALFWEIEKRHELIVERRDALLADKVPDRVEAQNFGTQRDDLGVARRGCICDALERRCQGVAHEEKASVELRQADRGCLNDIVRDL
jgi:hypothetical protein